MSECPAARVLVCTNKLKVTKASERRVSGVLAAFNAVTRVPSVLPAPDHAHFRLASGGCPPILRQFDHCVQSYALDDPFMMERDVNDMSVSRTYHAQAVTRACEILMSFEGENPVQTPAEVARATGINRTTAYRLLRSLEAGGLVRRQEDGYGLTPAVLRLAEVFLARLGDLESVAEPILVRLRDDTEETSALHIRDGLARVVIRQVESQHELRRHYPDVGRPLPLHVGAPSIVILASLTEPAFIEYCRVAGNLFPDAPPVSSYLDAVATVRRTGYAVSHGQRSPGVSSVAAAIRGREGAAIGAINVSGPTGRFGDAAVERFAVRVRRAAAELSARLGYEPAASQPFNSTQASEVLGGT